MTPDPYKAALGGTDPNNPQSWNRYAYVVGDSINYYDPSGEFRRSPDDPSPNNPNPCIIVNGEPDCPEPLQDPSDTPDPSIDCGQLAKAVGLPGLDYGNALRIWRDGNLSNYSTDDVAAIVASLAAVTWQGESSFRLNPVNNPNMNQAGVVTSVDYGPFQINQHFNPNSNGAVWGTSGAGQTFNGSPDANITFGIKILEGLYTTWGNTAAGHYVGSLGTDKAGNTTLGQKRQNTWNSFSKKLISFFSNTDCFTHQ